MILYPSYTTTTEKISCKKIILKIFLYICRPKRKIMALHDLLKDEIFTEELDAWKLSHAENNIYYYIENRNNILQEKQWYEKTHLTNKNLEQIIKWYDSLSVEEIDKIKKRKISDIPRIAAIQKETLFELKVAESYYNDEFFQKFC